MPLFLKLNQLIEKIEGGSLVVLPPDYSYVPMTSVFSLIKQSIKNLHIVFAPIGGLAADLLIGSGCVKSVEAGAITLGEFGPAPRFTESVVNGSIEFKDSTCPAIHTALQASEKGVPFMPLRGLIGSDVLKNRPDWKIIGNPFVDNEDKIVLLPSIKPDIALIHAPLADQYGNIWIGKRRELLTMAHAAETTYVTVEKIQNEDLLSDEKSAAGTIPEIYIGGIALAKKGSWPLALPGHYEEDTISLSEYSRSAQTQEEFDKWVQFILKTRFDEI